jgi:hypothetical protein
MPFTEQGLNETLCLAVGAGPVGAGAQMAQAKLATGLGVSR